MALHLSYYYFISFLLLVSFSEYTKRISKNAIECDYSLCPRGSEQHIPAPLVVHLPRNKQRNHYVISLYVSVPNVLLLMKNTEMEVGCWFNYYIGFT
jgi:hypothetical protein